MVFDFTQHANKKLPATETPWNGFPKFNFIGGHNDPEGLPLDLITAAANSVLLRDGKKLATYCLQNGPQGYLPLREFLVGKLKRYAGMQTTAGELLLTSGSLQAIDLINAALLAPGDTVVVEESNYGGVLSRCAKLDVNMVGIPLDRQGMQTDILASVLDSFAQQGIKPKYIYTIPTIHNPTGTIMSMQRRQHLIELAVQHNIAIVEDECYADLVWEGNRPPALHALDTTRRVVHIGSFSKTIAPALRVGYVVANWSLLGQLLALKSDAGSGAVEQMLLAEFCHEHFDRHVTALNARLRRKLDALTAAIDREFGSIAEFDYPPGGIFLWVTLPPEVDTTRLAAAAAAEGVAINPGNDWSLEPDASRRLRLCFANPDIDTIEAGIAKLARICFEQFGVPRYGANQNRDGGNKY